MGQKNNRIRYKITKLNMISVLSIIIVMGVLIMGFTVSTVKQKAKNDLQHGTKTFAIRFDEDFLSKQVIVNSFEAIVRETFDTTRLDESGYIAKYKSEIESIVRNFAKFHGDLYIFFNSDLQNEAHDIWFLDYDLDGIIDRVPEIGIDYYDGDVENKAWYYEPINQGKGVWIEPYKSTIIVSYHFVSYTKPIYVDDILVGVTGTDFILEDIMEDVKEAEFKTKSASALLNEEGKILLHSRSEDILGSKIAYEKELLGSFEKIKGKDQGVIEYTNGKNQSMVMSFNRLVSGWYLISYISEDEIYENLYAFIIRLVIVFAVLIAVSLYIASRIGKSISRPIEELTEHISNMGDQVGDELLHESLLQNKDEIGILANSFVKMKRQLKGAYEEIEKQNVDLDTKVSIRTEELTAINQELIATLEVLENAREELIDVKTYESLETVFSGISHRLGGPIGNALVSLSTIIKEITSTKMLLENDLLTKSKFLSFIEKSEELSTVCLMSVENAHELIKSLNSIEKGFLDKDTQNFDVNEIFTSVIGVMEEQLKEKGISVKFKKDEKIYMHSHSKIFYIVLMNFIKFSLYQNFKNNDAGNIYIKTRLEENKFILKYWDDGKAISKEEIDTLFDPFSISRFTQNMTGFELYQNFQLISRSLNGTIKYNEHEDAFIVVVFIEE